MNIYIYVYIPHMWEGRSEYGKQAYVNTLGSKWPLAEQQ